MTLKDLLGLGSSDERPSLSAGLLLPTLIVLMLVAGALARLLDTGTLGSLLLLVLAGASCTPLALLVGRRLS